MFKPFESGPLRGKGEVVRLALRLVYGPQSRARVSHEGIKAPRRRPWPEADLRIVDQLGLDNFRYLHSTRGELLRRLGRIAEARDA
jgi:hypothetical protein